MMFPVAHQRVVPGQTTPFPQVIRVNPSATHHIRNAAHNAATMSAGVGDRVIIEAAENGANLSRVSKWDTVGKVASDVGYAVQVAQLTLTLTNLVRSYRLMLKCDEAVRQAKVKWDSCIKQMNVFTMLLATNPSTTECRVGIEMLLCVLEDTYIYLSQKHTELGRLLAKTIQHSHSRL